MLFACEATPGSDAGHSLDAGNDGGQVKTDGGQPLDAGTPWEQFCAAQRSAYCGAFVRCGLFSTAAGCELSLGNFGCGETPRGLADGRSIFDEDAGAACVAAVAIASCDVLEQSGCEGVLKGQGTDGADCYAGTGECGGGFFCDLSATCPGVCRPVAAQGTAPVAGQPCAGGTYEFEGVCTAYTPASESCAPLTDGGVEKLCVASAYCDQGLCTARPLRGQSCTTGVSEFDYAQCAGASRCVEGECGPLRDVSQPCGPGAACRSDLRCGDGGVCVARGLTGERCEPYTGDCALSHFCDENQGECRPYRSEGEVCTVTGGECALSGELFCTADVATMDAGVCARVKEPGEACAGPWECRTGLCDQGQCVGCLDTTP